MLGYLKCFCIFEVSMRRNLKPKKMKSFKNTKFTDLEKQVLRNYLPEQSVYDFGQSPMRVNDIGNNIWINENVNLSNETIKGVVGSLTKKGLLASESNFIWLNEVFRDNKNLLKETIKIVK